MNTLRLRMTFVNVVAILLCNAIQAQTTPPTVENHLNGELDHTHETLNLVQRQANGEQIVMGKITKDGAVHFDLPEFDIKALYDSIPLQHYNFHQLFSIGSDCKNRDVFTETPFDDVYSQKYDPLYIEKYGITVAVLYPISDEKLLEGDNRTVDVGSHYYWFYMDRDIDYNEGCTKTYAHNPNYQKEVSTDIQFKKGWNFLKQEIQSTEKPGENGEVSTQRKIYFTGSSPESKEIKWYLKQIAEDERIASAKKLYNLTPITKKQFEAWVPKKLNNLRIATKEYGKPPEGQENKNNIHLIYSNKTKKVELYVIDCAKRPDDMEMIDFAYAMENHDKDEKDQKPYVAKYNESDKSTQLLYKAEDRIIVEAIGSNVNAEELWGYMKELRMKKLLKK